MNLEKQTYSEYRAMNPDNPTAGERFVMRDHAIFDMQADAFIGAGDACYLLNQQHPTTGEWTAETVDRMFPRGGAKGIADAHNAELAAEREYARNAGFNEGVVHEIGRTVEAQQQLAAEKKKFDTLASTQFDLERTAMDWCAEAKQLREQLDAEREAGVKALAERSFELHECQKHLTAAVEALRKTKDALNSSGYITPIIDAALAALAELSRPDTTSGATQPDSQPR